MKTLKMHLQTSNVNPDGILVLSTGHPSYYD